MNMRDYLTVHLDTNSSKGAMLLYFIAVLLFTVTVGFSTINIAHTLKWVWKQPLACSLVVLFTPTINPPSVHDMNGILWCYLWKVSLICCNCNIFVFYYLCSFQWYLYSVIHLLCFFLYLFYYLIKKNHHLFNSFTTRRFRKIAEM